jgi:membrane-associated phospholipid phosphatase
MTKNEPKQPIFGTILGAALSISVFILSYCFFDDKLLFLAEDGLLKGDLAKSINLTELFGHGTGILLVALLIFFLDRSQSIRFLAPTIIAASAGALLKLFFLRVRPSQLPANLLDDTDRRITFQIPWPSSVSDEHGLIHDGVHSFPSGHATTAFAMATALSVIYPKGRFLFFAIAILACAQRLFAGAHYLSDVIAGAILGYVLATITICISGAKGQK